MEISDSIGQDLSDEMVRISVTEILLVGTVLASSITSDDAWRQYKAGIRLAGMEIPGFSELMERYFDHAEANRKGWPRPMSERISMSSGMGLLRDLKRFHLDNLSPESLADIQQVHSTYQERHPGSEFSKLLAYLDEM